MHRIIYDATGLRIELRPVTLRGLLEAQSLPPKDLSRTTDWMAKHVARVEVQDVSIGAHLDGAVEIQARDLCPTHEQAREILFSLPLKDWRGVLDLLEGAMKPKREDADPGGGGQPQP
jgi:hypothetical protein